MTNLSTANSLYLGSTAVDRVYLGAVKVWPPFSPSLFYTGSEAGAWFDIGEPVAMLLAYKDQEVFEYSDYTPAALLGKREGIEVGPEIFSDGLITSIDDWTKNGRDDADIVDGVFIPGGATRYYRDVSLPVGVPVHITSDLVNDGSSPSFMLQVKAFAGAGFSNELAGSYTGSLIFTPTAPVTRLYLFSQNTPTASISYISARPFLGSYANQPDASKQAAYKVDVQAGARTARYLLSDTVDDSLPAEMTNLGTDATVWYANEHGSYIQPGQTVTGTFETLRGEKTYAVGAIDRALTRGETLDLITYLEKKRDAPTPSLQYFMAKLFGMSGQGAWFDPSDPSTLFTDLLRGQPVTSTGQLVALMMGKPEKLPLVSTPTSIPVKGQGYPVIGWDGSVLTVTGANNSSAAFPFDTVIGETYHVSVDHLMDDKGWAIVSSDVNFWGTNRINITPGSTSYGIHNVSFVATHATHYLHILNESTNSTSRFINIIVRKPDGYAMETDVSKRPTYQSDGTSHWLESDLVDDTLTATIPDLGTDATVWYANEDGAFIPSSKTISGSFETLRGEKTYAVGAIDRALSSSERMDMFLYLDQRRGHPSTPVAIDNGTFDTDVSGWTNQRPDHCEFDWVNGRGYLHNTSGATIGGQTAQYSVPTVPGKTYTISAQLETEAGATRIVIQNTTATTRQWVSVQEGLTDVSLTFTATGTSVEVNFELASFTAWTSGSGYIDNIFMREHL